MNKPIKLLLYRLYFVFLCIMLLWEIKTTAQFFALGLGLYNNYVNMILFFAYMLVYAGAFAITITKLKKNG